MSRRGSATRDVSRDVSPGDLRVAGMTGALVAVGLLVLALVTAYGPSDAVRSPGAAGWLLGVVALTASCTALLWRRAAPRAVLLATAVALLVCAVSLGDAVSMSQFPVFVAAYTLGTAAPFSRTWPTYAGAALVITVGSTLGALDGGESTVLAVGLGVVQGLLTVAVPLAVAVVVTARREITEARASRAAALEREREALVQAAIARERTEMARELHDIAAHHLSGITVMTAAIGTQIDTDPAAAKEAVAQVRRQSKAVLNDLRELVGLLRDDSSAVTTERVRLESLAGVSALVEDVTSAGRDVRLTVLSGQRPLGDGVGPLAQLAAYRMAQESLANAARHSPGSVVEVTLDDRDATRAVLTVRNASTAALPAALPTAADGRGGFGLVGMRERAELTGARLEAGPTTDGGWQVRLTLPRDQTTRDQDDRDHTDGQDA